MTTKMTSGSTVLHARNLHGLSIADLAALVHIEPKTIAAIEANKLPMDVDLAMRLAQALQVQPALLLPKHAVHRLYEGVVHPKQLVGDSGAVYEPWRCIEGLEGKRVRVTIEVLGEKGTP